MVVAARERAVQFLGDELARLQLRPRPRAARGAADGKIGFFMYPQCETAEGRLDSLDPDNFKYQIVSKEIGV
ncbi:MAG: hypothetical protein MZW92_43060 [Comamonadaceae bacterium]|nr:hypothetical protein [Comamonadaceae bacterium]